MNDLHDSVHISANLRQISFVTGKNIFGISNERVHYFPARTMVEEDIIPIVRTVGPLMITSKSQLTPHTVSDQCC